MHERPAPLKYLTHTGTVIIIIIFIFINALYAKIDAKETCMHRFSYLGLLSNLLDSGGINRTKFWCVLNWLRLHFERSLSEIVPGWQWYKCIESVGFEEPTRMRLRGSIYFCVQFYDNFPGEPRVVYFLSPFLWTWASFWMGQNFPISYYPFKPFTEVFFSLSSNLITVQWLTTSASF